MADDKRLLSVAEVASLLGLHPKQLSAMLAAGEFPGTRVGRGRGVWRIRREDVDAYLDARGNAAWRSRHIDTEGNA
ncbi:MAG: helix-turn-helix domain-containing protein [Bacillota bacterium]|jgi:excisionase family DNA binding protein